MIIEQPGPIGSKAPDDFACLIRSDLFSSGEERKQRVLICGGCVIGASITYFLSCRGVLRIAIERTSLASPTSGKVSGPARLV